MYLFSSLILFSIRSSNHLAKHGFIPSNDESELLRIISRHVGDMLGAAQHNLTNDDRRFERQIYYTEVPESAVQEFEEYSNKKSQALLDDYRKWLGGKEKEAAQDNSEKNTGLASEFIILRMINSTGRK